MIAHDDVRTIGDATLILGDCREILPLLTFDVIVSDPPYGIGWNHGVGGGKVRGRRLPARRFFASIPGDADPFAPSHLLAWPCVLFGANHYCRALPDGRWHAWDKACGVGPEDDFSDVEFIWTSFKRKSSVIRYLWKGVLQDGEKGERRVHPTQKPVAVMAEVVQWTKGVVCDPYMGSGSTGVACARLGRPFIGIEIDPRHFETACKRLEEARRQPSLFVERKPKPEQGGLAL